jgi:hypothetical protein
VHFLQRCKAVSAERRSRQPPVYLFLKTTIVQQKAKYAYGYKFNEERMNKQSILLPVDEQGKPDWAFMEEYIREREENLVEEYRQCILNRYVM